MAKAINQLDALSVSKTKKVGRYADGNGLYLQVTPTGSKSWLFRYMISGKSHQMGLGSTSILSLKEARKKVAELRLTLLSGTDPLKQRQATAKANASIQSKIKTFGECVEMFLKRKTFNNIKHGKQWRATLETYAYPHLKYLPVADITIGDIKAVLDPIWQTKTETASRLQGRIKTVIDAAIVDGYRERANPALWSGYLSTQYDNPNAIKTVVHMPSMPYSKMFEFTKALRKHDTISARALEFLILTAVRSENVRSAIWSQFDMKAKVWTIPQAQTKTKTRTHTVPLSDQAVTILKELKRFEETELVFPSPTLKKMSDSTISKLMREMIARGDVSGHGVPHGFRATFSTWRLEKTTYSQELGEYALMHEVGDAVYQAYQRSDGLEKRRAIMQDWATFINLPYVDASQSTNVVNLNTKRAK